MKVHMLIPSTGGCDFVSYTESELAEISAVDQKVGRHWSPPALVSPAELCLKFKDAGLEEQPAEEVLVVAEPPVVEEGPSIEERPPSNEGQTPVEETPM